MNYRQIYKDLFGDIPTGYVIHHINNDHYDDKPINLVAIPRKLHCQYHNAYNRLKEYDPQRMVSDGKYFIELLNKFETYYISIINIANRKY
jgi:hypothetical protein